MTDGPLHWWSARAIAAAIRDRDISAVEVMRAHLDRIASVNDKVNALVSVVHEDVALAAAADADRAVARGDALGPLHGLPTAVKDLVDVRGIRTTHGSRADANAAPAKADGLVAKRVRAAGALIIGKTNTAERGVGTLTFNAVFGVTRNPYDLSRHAGGSSGGAAAALAAGMLPIADGSDSGGSLRYPAAFCNVVGLRPSPGRVPDDYPGDAWSPHGVVGPMARDSRDLGLVLAGLAGRDDRAPSSLDEDPSPFAEAVPTDLRRLRIAWSNDADGLPVSPEIRTLHARGKAMLEGLGCTIVDAEPDFTGADRAWETIEMFRFFEASGGEGPPHLLRAEYLRNIHQGAQTTASELAEALRIRTRIYRQTARLLRDHDVLALPATPVPAPPAELEWVKEIDGVAFDRYFGWQHLANRITMTAHPALVTPVGFTDDGLPAGLQLVGRYRGELALLRHAIAIEDATGWTRTRPTGLDENGESGT